MNKKKIGKKAVILIVLFAVVILFVLYSRFCFGTWNPSKVFSAVKSVNIDHNETYLIKKAFYCSGCEDKHWQGFLFVDYGVSGEQAMKSIGYSDIGHVYTDWHTKKKYTEYCTSEYGEHTIIYAKRPCLGGYIIEYHVVGVC